MSVVAEICFSKGWMDKKQRECGQLSPQLLETTLYAFDLLGALARRGLPFVFKGGTAILLLTDKFRRLSIDVDIAMPMTRDEVMPVLEGMVASTRFLDVQALDRDPLRLPKRHHYLFHYPSVYRQEPGSLQLDILEDDAHYPVIVERPIAHSLMEVDEEVRVRVPTVEGLLGDKLTAFAPTTIGILYGSYKSGIRIAKQICDIGELFNYVGDLAAVQASYNAFVTAEVGYRERPITHDEVDRDRLAAAELVGYLHTKWQSRDENSDIMDRGIRSLDSHMIGKRYTFVDAKVAAAKAAALTAAFKSTGLPLLDDMRYAPERAEVLKRMVLPPPLDKLNILQRGGNAEAFHYWNQAHTYLNNP